MLHNLGVAVDEPSSVIPDSNPDAPAPRGAHSAVLINDHVWVFGGYGGAGYQRRDFNDVHRLHVPTMTWSKVEVVPTPAGMPEPRSGHIAQVGGGASRATSYAALAVLTPPSPAPLAGLPHAHDHPGRLEQLAGLLGLLVLRHGGAHVGVPQAGGDV